MIPYSDYELGEILKAYDERGFKKTPLELEELIKDHISRKDVSYISSGCSSVVKIDDTRYSYISFISATTEFDAGLESLIATYHSAGDRLTNEEMAHFIPRMHSALMQIRNKVDNDATKLESFYLIDDFVIIVIEEDGLIELEFNVIHPNTFKRIEK